MTAVTHLRSMLLATACVAGLVAAGCGATTPTTPTPVAATPAPAPTPPPPAATPGALSVTVTPNPVPWSSVDVPGCGSDRPNRWVYEQTLKNTGGTAITVNDRVDFFDGSQSSTRTGLGISIAPGAESTLTTRWCSVSTSAHTARTNFSGTDTAGNAVSFTGVEVRLLPK